MARPSDVVLPAVRGISTQVPVVLLGVPGFQNAASALDTPGNVLMPATRPEALIACPMLNAPVPGMCEPLSRSIIVPVTALGVSGCQRKARDPLGRVAPVI